MIQEARKKDIRKKADQIRRNFKISDYGILNLFKESVSLGYKLIRYPLGESADLGFTQKKDDDIIIFTNSSARLSREIFTLAHEIGNASLNNPCNVIDIPYDYIEYVIYNYNHGAIPKETLEKALECYNLSIEDISDKIIEPVEDDTDLDELIGGLPD